MYTGGLENHPALIDRLAQIRPLWGNAANVVRQVRRPETLALVALESGCRFPQLNATNQDLALPPRGCYLQQYIAGQPASAVFVAAAGRALLLGATQQLVGNDFSLSRQFLYAGSVGPFELSPEMTGALHRLASTLARQFHFIGLFNIDFVVADDEIWLLEVNPRYSASVEVLERAYRAPFVAFHAAACRHSELPAIPPASSGRYFGKAVVYSDSAGTVPSAIDAVAHSWLNTDGSPGLADLPHVGEKLSAGQPVVTVLASGQSLRAVTATLRTRVLKIQRILKASEAAGGHGPTERGLDSEGPVAQCQPPD
jgi:predicted ATP-grasp superfamily ATP-dependent carboligase